MKMRTLMVSVMLLTTISGRDSQLERALQYITSDNWE